MTGGTKMRGKMMTNKRLRCCLIMVIYLSGVFFVSGLMAEQTIQIKEKYSEDKGGYRDGKYGKALWLFTSDDKLEYPIIFADKQVEEGAISLWFRPTRQVWEYEYDRFFLFSDGKQNIKFSIYSGHPKKTELSPRSLWVTGATPAIKKRNWYHCSTGLSNNSHEQFHHILFTWNKSGSKTYLDGGLIAEKQNKGKWFIPFDGSKTTLSLAAKRGLWVDELVILDKYLGVDEAKSLYRSVSTWQTDSHTALYISFDNSLSAQSIIGADGDIVRLYSYIGHRQATFKKDDPIRIEFTIVNSTQENKKLILHGSVKNLNKKEVLKKRYKVKVGKGSAATVNFDMELREKGLFWGDYYLEDLKGNILARERIPFAATLAVDVRKYKASDIPTGLVISRGINPPCYEKWAGFETQSYWLNLEYAPGKWDFEKLDMIVEDAVRTGRAAHLMLVGTPLFYSIQRPLLKENVKTHKFSSPKNIEAFKDYVKRLGTRYKGKVYDYEVWNEPYFNDPAAGYFQGTTEQYIELVKIASETLHKIDPEIKVCCGMGGGGSWQQKVAKGTAGYVDYYGTHPYSLAKIGSVDERNVLKSQELLREAGASVRLANTEISDMQLGAYAIDEDGYPMTAEEFDKSGRWEKVADNMRRSGRDYFHDDYTSAASVVRSLILSIAGGCEYFLWWSAGSPSAWGNLTGRIHTPSLASVAYANASGILAGYKFVKRVDIGADYLKVYLFKEKNNNKCVLVAWADKDPHSVNIELGKGDIEVLDTQGNNYPFEKFGPVIKTTLTMTPVYIRGLSKMPAVSRPILKAESTKDFVFPGEVCQVKICIHNPFSDKPIKGELMLKLPEKFAEQPVKSVELGPKETGDYLFEFAVPHRIAGNQKMTANLITNVNELKNITQYSTLAIRQNAEAKKITTQVKIDGKLEEWGDIDKFPIRIDQPGQVVIGTPHTKLYIPKIDWKGPEDLSMKAALAYDYKNLYIAIRVYDDKLMNLTAKANPQCSYQGDCVEIFIDGRGEEKQGDSRYTQDVYQALFVPAMTDFPAPIYHLGQPLEYRLSGMAFNSAILEDGYSLEIRIPLSNFPRVNFKSGANIGFDIAVDDKDEEKDGTGRALARKSQLVWAGTKGNSSDASLFGRIIFK